MLTLHPLKTIISDLEKNKLTNKINTSNGIFKSINENAPGNLEGFLENIGFTRKSETQFEYELPNSETGEKANENEFSSNVTALSFVVKQLEAD